MPSEDPIPPNKAMSLQEIYDALGKEKANFDDLVHIMFTVLQMAATRADPALLDAIGVDTIDLNRIDAAALNALAGAGATMEAAKTLVALLIERE